MEDGEKVEGEGNQQPAPSFPTPGSRLRFPPGQNPFINLPGIQPPMPSGVPPPPGLSSIFANNPSFFHPLHDTTSHENLPPQANVFGPPAPAHQPRLGDQGTVKQFDFRYENYKLSIHVNTHIHFRHNKMPEGVTIIGEGQLEEQQDKSTALVLGPKSCLNLNRMFFASSPSFVLTLTSSWIHYPTGRPQVCK